ncbi:hypothetical protein [Candidatus Finniella inopinata]|uniref:Uncharacterized protein n=1 Tax=Candidatus Finniella inopinata TaxID=1696036 RepID=A0A4Q7DFX1_9PROT|nr:hypothetical protein [Candidatus Finniella inopinata]RZI45663.1 hypothetical protein EQU50_06060 [Candidatus Finniella inopinata]
MLNFSKYALLIVGTLSASISGVWAEFKKDILNGALKMASDKYKIDGNQVNLAVQAANFLAHDLKRESDPTRAKNIADTLFGLVSKGEGVGGISETPANDRERRWMIDALQEGTRFLKAHQNLPEKAEPLTEASLAEKLKSLAVAAKAHEQQHLDEVKRIILGALGAGAGGNVYNAAIQKQIEQRVKDEVVAFGRELDTLKGAKNPLKKSNPKDIIDFLTEKSKSLVVPLALTQAAIDQTTDLAAKPDALINLTNILKETVIPQRAYQSAEAIREILKKIDFSDLSHMPAGTIEALIAVEKYRMFETKQSSSDAKKEGLAWNDPTVFDYQGTTQSAQSEAVLLALVSAIQNYLYNIARTPEDLIRLFKYEMNSRNLKSEYVRDTVKDMLQQKITDRVIDEKLLQDVNTAQLNISKVQKLAIDAVAMRQSLMFYSIPKFNIGTLHQETALPPKFILYFGSSGSGLQCGFFSLGFANRDEALELIIDNLCEPEILAMADSNLQSGSADIKAVLGNWQKLRDKSDTDIKDDFLKEALVTRRRTLEGSKAFALAVSENKRSDHQKKMADLDIDKTLAIEKEEIRKKQEARALEILKQREAYLELYAKNKNIDISRYKKGEATARKELLDRFFAEYDIIIKAISADEKRIDSAIEQRKTELGMAGIVSESNAHNVAIATINLQRQKLQAQNRLVQFIYPIEDFKKVVENDMKQKFDDGELEFDPNPDWALRTPSYPQIIAEMNNYNIYAWVTKSQFDRMQREEGADVASPVYQTSDGEYVLVQYLPGGERGKSISLLNKYGGHFEKWIEADDYPRLARAVRHKQLHGVDDTRR